MPTTKVFSLTSLPRDLTAGLVVFLVAVPLCPGIALASNAPLFAALLAGIVVGIVRQSHTSVNGPAAGFSAIVAAEIVALGSFETFLLAVMVGGMIQLGLELARAGYISAFFPGNVVKGPPPVEGCVLRDES